MGIAPPIANNGLEGTEGGRSFLPRAAAARRARALDLEACGRLHLVSGRPSFSASWSNDGPGTRYRFNCLDRTSV
ncbi:hypothetical protein RHS04_01524 [Rhizoctonia solani]|uniref:Uncharacterized protein n=1 Tax=Rhizoctonia solani TaxID=456999 RepID=A0A8H7HCV6_9AGAM|nr:hypothetical protein RHS04_01524 [Rhizoctonia solani]